MDKCINTKHPEFIELAKQANMNPLVLKSKIGVWQERNNSDEFPTLEEILNPNEANYQLKIVNALINGMNDYIEQKLLECKNSYLNIKSDIKNFYHEFDKNSTELFFTYKNNLEDNIDSELNIEIPEHNREEENTMDNEFINSFIQSI